MKNTAKILSLFLTLALVFVCVVACGQTPVDNTPETQSSETVNLGDKDKTENETGETENTKPETPTSVVTVVVGGANEKVFNVDFSSIDLSDGALSVLNYIKEETGLAVEFSGGMLSRVGDLASSGSTYIFIWTNVEKDFDVSGWVADKTWNGNTLTVSGVGINEMTVENGAIIYIGTVEF